MHATEDQLETVFDKLTEYKETIKNGDTLEANEDFLELEVEDGEIWLHPQDDGTTVDIHFMDETGEYEYDRESSRVTNHLIRELGLPAMGQYEPHTGYMGNERLSRKANFEYFHDTN